MAALTNENVVAPAGSTLEGSGRIRRLALPGQYARLLIPRVLGLFLIIAGLLKSQSYGTGPIGLGGIFADKAFQVILIEYELLLGLWLLSGRHAASSWALALGTFFGFLCLSAYEVWLGVADCGCFGQLSVAPYYAAGVDAFALVALLFVRPRLREEVNASSQGEICRLASPVLAALGVFFTANALAAYLAIAYFGSVGAAFAFLQGHPAYVVPGVVDVGTGPTLQVKEFVITVANVTGQPIRIVGGTYECSCTVATRLPVTVEPHGTTDVSFAVKLPRLPGAFVQRAHLLVEDEGLKKIAVNYTGRAVVPD